MFFNKIFGEQVWFESRKPVSQRKELLIFVIKRKTNVTSGKKLRADLSFLRSIFKRF